MTAVRKGTCDQPSKVTDLSDIRPPTDVMAITSLPQGMHYPDTRYSILDTLSFSYGSAVHSAAVSSRWSWKRAWKLSA